jgi:hypothetical protein
MTDELLEAAHCKLPWKYNMNEFKEVMGYLDNAQAQWSSDNCTVYCILS